MFAIIAIILVIVIVALELRNSTSTADLSTSGNSTDTTNPSIYQNDNSTSDNGLSPIDIGGLSLNIPNAVLSWRSLAEKYAQINSILDPEEILAIIWNESSGNPNAQNPGDPSWGLMGVTNLIGTAYAGATSSQLFDPETNVKAGSAYLAHLKSRFGNNDDWSESYNEGETNYANGKHYNPGYSVAFNNHLNALKGLG